MKPLRHLDLLLLGYGNLRVSPRQALQLNESPIRTISLCTTLQYCGNSQANVNPATESGEHAGYRLMFTGYAQHILNSEAKNNRAKFLGKALAALRANPRPSHAYSLKGSVDTYSVSDDHYRIDYRVYSGQVTVYNIQPVDRVQLMRDKFEQPAMYHVRKDKSGIWQSAAKVHRVVTPYAAINGQSNNLAKARWLMGSHLEWEFGGSLQEYTLFHNPSKGGLRDTWESIQDKFGITTRLTKQFAACLQESQQKQQTTRWVAHSQGGIIFTEAVRYTLNDNSAWPGNKFLFNGINHPQKGEVLDTQSVAFHGTANNNVRSKPLLQRAGVEVINIYAHAYDLVPNLIGANTLRPSKIIGSLLYANLVFGGSPLQSPHTMAQSMQSWQTHMQSGVGEGRSGIQQAARNLATSAAAGVRWIKNFLP